MPSGRPTEKPVEFPSGDTPGPTISLSLRVVVDGPPSAALATRTGKPPAAPVSPEDPPSDTMMF